jgi:two-component system chemotaxis sensor kinase CheA
MVQGLCYQESKGSFRTIAKYAFTGEKTPENFKPGETLGGQAALNQEMMLISDIPETYFKIESGLGQTYPKHLVFVPVIYRKKTIALLEMAYFVSLDEQTLSVFRELTGYLGERFAKFMK